MAEVFDTAGDVIDSFAGTETDEEAFFALLDFSAKEVAVAASQRLGEGVGPGGGTAPNRANILAIEAGAANSNFDNLTAEASIPMRYSDNTDGAWIEWGLSLAEGTYALYGHFSRYSTGGIGVFSLSDDGGATRNDIDDPPYDASNAAVDTYNADPDAAYFVTVASDITVPADGEYRLRCTVTDNHASSGGFQVSIKSLVLAKVGD